MAVLTWQSVNGVANLLPIFLRVGNPANLDMRYIVYEAPQNAHRDINPNAQDVRVSDPLPKFIENTVVRRMGLASSYVAMVPPDG